MSQVGGLPTRRGPGPIPAVLAEPWAWRPSSSAWFQRLGLLISDWRPSSELDADLEPIRVHLLAAAEGERAWLHHPCIDVLVRDTDEDRVQRDFQLLVWLASQGEYTLGTVRLSRPLWAWAPDGGRRVSAGLCDLDALGTSLAAHDWPWAIALDLWCRTTGGTPAEQSWAQLPPETPDDEALLDAELRMFFRALSAARDKLPDCFEWVRAMTQVVVPMRRLQGRPYSRSASSPQMPGLAYLTLHSELQVLEALVHETAHHYLFLVQAVRPLVDPAHSVLYRSPLRPDPRPLLGVLLAYHALVYIGSLYADILRHDLGPEDLVRRELALAREKMLDAGQTLQASRTALTDIGDEFFAKSLEIAAFSDGL